MKHSYTMLVVAIACLAACTNLLPSESLESVKDNNVPVIKKIDPIVEPADVKQSGNRAQKNNNNGLAPKSDKSKPVISKSVPKVSRPTVEIKTIGQVEYVDILPEGIRQKARIDTGAETTSIDALDIEYFERDGKSWVKFKVVQRRSGNVTEFTKPIVRNVLIKRHGAKNDRRPVIKMTLAIGSIKKKIEVSLTDRSKFEFPVLIGRNFLYGDIMVDVSNKFLMLDK